MRWCMMAQYKWNPWFWVQAVTDPAYAFDLVDARGKTDHSKIVPFLLLIATVVAHFLGKPFSIGELTVLFSAAYGYGMFRTFIKSGTFKRTETATETKTTTINHTIAERRDPERGIDPA